ncbi:hypothetical protein BU15DRAFT_65839 [Melanogaster broomeanus]|nr:hypothetical protein BU15DRAFT_65839 [Melanogaster broomeanus]
MKLTAAPTIPTSRLRPNLIPLPNHASGNPRHNSSSPNAVVRRIHQRTVPETAQTTDKHGRVFNRAILEGLARVGFRMNLDSDDMLRAATHASTSSTSSIKIKSELLSSGSLKMASSSWMVQNWKRTLSSSLRGKRLCYV